MKQYIINTLEAGIKNYLGGETPYLNVLSKALLSKSVFQITRLIYLDVVTPNNELVFLANSFIIYIRERTASNRSLDSYYDYLSDNDYDEYDVSYEEYLARLGDEETSVSYSLSRIELMGPIIHNAKFELARLGINIYQFLEEHDATAITTSEEDEEDYDDGMDSDEEPVVNTQNTNEEYYKKLILELRPYQGVLKIV